MTNDFEPARMLSILEKIASGFSPASEEYLSVEVAAKAILFIHATGKKQSFQAYLDTVSQELTPEQKNLLAAMGLE